MRVSELNEMVTIDTTIQSLLRDLQDLYAKRQQIVETGTTTSTSRRTKAPKKPTVNSLDFDEFDLTLTKSLLPKRRHIFG